MVNIFLSPFYILSFSPNIHFCITLTLICTTYFVFLLGYHFIPLHCVPLHEKYHVITNPDCAYYLTLCIMFFRVFQQKQVRMVRRELVDKRAIKAKRVHHQRQHQCKMSGHLVLLALEETKVQQDLRANLDRKEMDHQKEVICYNYYYTINSYLPYL